jgi:hypothetical protein
VSTTLFTSGFEATGIVAAGFTGIVRVFDETSCTTSTSYHQGGTKSGKVTFFWESAGGALANSPTYIYKDLVASDASPGYKTINLDYWLYFDSNFELIDEVLPLLAMFPTITSGSQTTPSMYVYVSADGINSTTAILAIHLNDAEDHFGDYNIVNNTWYHVVVTFACDGTSITGTVVLKDTGGTTLATLTRTETGADFTNYAVKTVQIGGARVAPYYSINHDTDNDISEYMDDVVVSTADVSTVTGVSPGSGDIAGGTAVTITGTRLTGTTGVNFGSTPATSVVVVSDTSVTCVSPAHSAGVVDVTAITPLGTTATGTADHFTYTSSADGGGSGRIIGNELIPG